MTANSGGAGQPLLEFPGGRLATTVFQFGPRHHFTTDFVRSVMRSETVTAVYRSTAVELQTDEHASVVLRVEARTSRGNRFFIRPRLVVLAMGGIEIARLLLLSDHVSRQGLGNRHDLVGRFFMDHYMIHSGYLYPRDPGIFDRTGLYDLRLADDSGLGIQGKLTLRPEVICDEHLLNAATYLVPRHRTWPYKARARESLRELRPPRRPAATAIPPAREEPRPVADPPGQRRLSPPGPEALPAPADLRRGMVRRPRQGQGVRPFRGDASNGTIVISGEPGDPRPRGRRAGVPQGEG